MPCAAPCNRLPCDRRCTETLSCGHQCPGVCGEICANGSCHECGGKQDATVDYLEFKTYADINPDETPIVVLACGHLLTAESLDGLIGMGDVYLTDENGKYIGFRDISSGMAKSVPCCPECRRPIQQFATRRYNRVVNRAVMDETSKRLLVKGRVELQALEEKAQAVEKELADTRSSSSISITRWRLQDRYKGAEAVVWLSRQLKSEMMVEHQPAKKLRDAMVKAKGKGATPQDYALSIDRDVYFGSLVMEFKVRDMMLRDKVYQYGRVKVKTAAAAAGASEQQQQQQEQGRVTKDGVDLLVNCLQLARQSRAENFPKVFVQLTLCHGRTAKALQSHCHSASAAVLGQVENARVLLGEALEMCSSLKFNGADQLKTEVEETLRLYSDRYEAMTAEEMASIKTAMVSGASGIASHSGHWYKCQKGHPVSTNCSRSFSPSRGLYLCARAIC